MFSTEQDRANHTTHCELGSRKTMMEETRTLMEHGWPFAVAVIAAAVRLLVTGARTTFLGAVRAIIVGGIVGVAMGGFVGDVFTAMEWSYGDRTRDIAIAVSAIIADDLVLAVIEVGRRMRKDPMGTVLSLFRGNGK